MIDLEAALTFGSTTEGYSRYTIRDDARWWKHHALDDTDGHSVSIVEVLLDVQDGDRRHVVEAQRTVESLVTLRALTSIRRGDVNGWEVERAALNRCCDAHRILALWKEPEQ